MNFHFVDDVYGDVVIQEPYLQQLLEAPEILRLKELGQAGAPRHTRPGRDVTRWEHSVGVMHLTRLLGGTRDEVVFGLLHDISHTAFSHTVDYVFGDERESYHDKFSSLSIYRMLSSGGWDGLGLDSARIQELAKDSLVDRPAPRLCADRIDYTLRDLVRVGDVTTFDARQFVGGLRLVGGEICCRSKDEALWFARCYASLVENYFINSEELAAHQRLARLLRRSLDQEIITREDLMTTDGVVLDAILRSDQFPEFFDATGSLRLTESLGERNVVPIKARRVDPSFDSAGRGVALSQEFGGYSAIWENIERLGKTGVVVYA